MFHFDNWKALEVGEGNFTSCMISEIEKVMAFIGIRRHFRLRYLIRDHAKWNIYRDHRLEIVAMPISSP